jgi:hypothetical protein
MRIEKVMETPDKYYGAYNYYKKHLENKSNMTRTAQLAQVARMFLIPNIKSFIKFADEMDASKPF